MEKVIMGTRLPAKLWLDRGLLYVADHGFDFTAFCI